MLICILTKNVITSCSVTLMLFLHLEVRPRMTLTTVLYLSCGLISFFFQAEDGIRDFHVTGVQTYALPISARRAGTRAARARARCTRSRRARRPGAARRRERGARRAVEPLLAARGRLAHERGRGAPLLREIGRASCREREYVSEVDASRQ